MLTHVNVSPVQISGRVIAESKTVQVFIILVAIANLFLSTEVDDASFLIPLPLLLLY